MQTQLEKEKRGLKIRQSRNHCTFIRLSLTDNNLDLCPHQRIQPTDQKIPWKFQSRDQKLLLNKEGGGGNPQDGTQPSNLWQ